jgi:hypothetical protein
LEDRDVDGDNIKMDFKKLLLEGVDWIYIAENMERWQAVMNTEMNLLVP